MLGLPRDTELKKQLSKHMIYSKFSLNTKARERFDEDIKKMTIINEVSTGDIYVEKNTEYKNFFVILISLKKKNFDKRNIILISKLINQNMLFILEYESYFKLAVYYKNFFATDWEQPETLDEFNFYTEWENVVRFIAGIGLEKSKKLDQLLEVRVKREKLRKKIEKMEKELWREKQPKRKSELAQQIAGFRFEFRQCEDD